MKKIYSKLALGVVGLIFVFAIASFLRENWSANEKPGMLETFLARWALSRARQAESSAQNPFQPTEANLQEGRQHYEKQCAFCHGLDGKGQGQTGIQFYPPVPSLVDQEGEMKDGQIQSIINKGIRYTAMPSFAKVLHPEEIWKVVLWVRHLPQQPPLPQQGPVNQSRDLSRRAEDREGATTRPQVPPPSQPSPAPEVGHQRQ